MKKRFIKLLIFVFVCLFLIECSKKDRFYTEEGIKVWIDSLLTLDNNRPVYYSTPMFYKDTNNIKLFAFDTLNNFYDEQFDSTYGLGLDIIMYKDSIKFHDLLIPDCIVDKSNMLKINAHIVDSIIDDFQMRSRSKGHYSHKYPYPYNMRFAIDYNTPLKYVLPFINVIVNRKIKEVYFICISKKAKPWPEIPDSLFIDKLKKKMEENKVKGTYKNSYEWYQDVSIIFEKEFCHCPSASHIISNAVQKIVGEWAKEDTYHYFILSLNNPSKKNEFYTIIKNELPAALIKCRRNNKKILSLIYSLVYHESNFIIWKNKIDRNGKKILLSESDKWEDVVLKFFKLRDFQIWIDIEVSK